MAYLLGIDVSTTATKALVIDERGAVIATADEHGARVTIGDRAIVGASAVVRDDVPAGKTAVGIPAKVIA